MARLPEELQRLKDRYEQLVADATAGAISREDAYRLLAQLTVIDSAGCQWGINDDGAFTRRRNPAEAPAVTNPGAFAPAAAAVPAAYATPPQARTPQPEPEPFEMPAVERSMDDDGGRRIAKPFERSAPERSSRKFDAVQAAVLKRPATLAVAVLVLASLVLSYCSRDGGSRTGSTPTSSMAATLPQAVQPSMPQPLPAAPSEQDALGAFAALSTDASTAAGVIVGGVADPVAGAQWSGFRALGYRFAAEPMATGSSTQRWILTNAQGTQQLVFFVSWVADAGVWKLAGWPQPA